MFDLALLIVIVWLANLAACIAIGARKRATLTSGFLAFLIGPLALPIVLISRGHMRECPECRCSVHPKARRCQHCRAELPAL